MRFDIYCDESRPDLLATKSPRGQYLVIGSLWLPTALRDECKEALHRLRDTHRIGGEFKWQKVSPSRLPFYLDLMQWFVRMSDRLWFRCIAVDREKVDLPAFHEDDQELGFYKFYYQNLLHWLETGNSYSVFCDFKSNRLRNRLHVLRECLQRKCPPGCEVANVQAIRSSESVLVQLADVLTGLASAKLNWSSRPGSAKAEVLHALEDRMGRPVRPTGRWTRPFNVFLIELTEGR